MFFYENVLCSISHSFRAYLKRVSLFIFILPLENILTTLILEVKTRLKHLILIPVDIKTRLMGPFTIL